MTKLFAHSYGHFSSEAVCTFDYNGYNLCLLFRFQIGTDFLEEKIGELEDYVQSVDVAAFNKL